jgi:hypothetical protein
MPDELPVFRIMWRDCGPMGSGEGFYAVRQDAKLVLGPYPNQIDAGKAAREWIEEAITIRPIIGVTA